MTVISYEEKKSYKVLMGKGIRHKTFFKLLLLWNNEKQDMYNLNACDQTKLPI